MTSAQKKRIVIIGAGSVGATTAYTLFLRQRADEIVLIDVNLALAEGESLDMQHGLPFVGGVDVRQGDYEACVDANIIIVTAGIAQKPGENRQELLTRNATIMRQIVQKVIKYNLDGILLIATNPVDVLSYLAYKESNWSYHRVIGSGTLLDTSRFRYLIGRELNVDPRSVHAHIIGEHGDSEVAVWSRATLAGMPMKVDASVRNRIAKATKNAAYQVINTKGYTSYAISLALDRICAAILNDEHAVLNVSTLVDGSKEFGQTDMLPVYVSVPCVVGARGIEQTLVPTLTGDEREQFTQSTTLLRQRIDLAMSIQNEKNDYK